MEGVVIYTRVSTDEQAKHGFSLAHQRTVLKKYCEIMNLNILEHFEDDGYPAKDFNRPGFIKLMQYCKENKSTLSKVLFTNWSRFSRNQIAGLMMVEEILSLGIDPNAVEQPIDHSIPEQKYLLSIYLTGPEVDNDIRARNTINGMERSKREGNYVAKPPKGYNPRKRSLDDVIEPNEDAHFILKAFEDVANNDSPIDHVRQSLNKKGFNCSKNHFINNILKNPVYIGKIAIRDKDGVLELIEGKHKAIVSEELFERVQNILNNKQRRVQKTKSIDPDLVLRGFLLCNNCGKKLTGSKSGGNGGKYAYHHCATPCTTRFRADKANEDFISYLNSLNISEEVASLYSHVLTDIYNSEIENQADKVKKIEEEIYKCKSFIEEAQSKLLQNTLRDDEYKSLRDKYEGKNKKLESELARIKEGDSSFLNYLDFGLLLFQDIGKYYQESSIEAKQALIGSMFPNNLEYFKNNYRTSSMNKALELIVNNNALTDKIERGLEVEKNSKSSKAPPPGLEPGTY